MQLSPIKSTASLVEQVSGRLSELVRDGLTNGDGLLPPERVLAEKLGVSRTVIREATKRLELQGLVEIRHGSGTRVVDKLHKPLNSSLSLLIPDEHERLRQLNETRLIIEPEAARMAAEKATVEQIAALHEIQQRMVDADTTEQAIEIDMIFHHLVAEISGNLIYRLILDSLADIGKASRSRTIGRVGKEKAILHHARIIQTIERGQPAAAEKAMRHHILAAGEDMALEQSSKKH